MSQNLDISFSIPNLANDMSKVITDLIKQAKQSKAILNWDEEFLSFEVKKEFTIIPVTCTQQRSTMKLISLERELESSILEDNDNEYEFKEEKLVDQSLYIVYEEQSEQLVLKIEVQENLIKINDEVIELEEKERIHQERLKDYNGCIHNRKENNYIQYKKEQDIYR
ncbi:11169_t:CDS:2 [Ambispora leptoticha]|uniref:11169_t:CDS:1 n=1 Tax=Ambispora leptoticha TaxID=144679 RepID=A0A9N9CV41_9GLOM|nr:11169_t:CDS:2 [Ambispora leptoticha]